MKQGIFNKYIRIFIISCLIGSAFAMDDTYTNKPGKAQSQSFNFIYGNGIDSVVFDPQYSEDSAGDPINSNDILIESYPGSIKITVTAGKNGSGGTAYNFNEGAGYTPVNPDVSHMLELMPSSLMAAHQPSIASKQNLLLDGELKINGHLVSSRFILGHNDAETNSNWWIGSIDGKRYDSPTNSGLNVKSIDSSDTYCINGYQNNYQAVITRGECDYYSPLPGNIKSATLTFFLYRINYFNSISTNSIFNYGLF